MEWAEEYFKKSNGYTTQNKMAYQKYQQYHINEDVEEEWRQDLIYKHIEELYKKESEIWIHISILIDLIYASKTHQKINLRRLIFELKKLRYMPVWNLLLILKPLVSSEHCLLDQVRSYPVLKNELEDIVDRYLPCDMGNEHENFVERYQHIYQDYLKRK